MLKRLTDAQLVEIGSIDVLTLLSIKRIQELYLLIEAGYPASAIICAIREASYAARHNIVIPPGL